MNKLALTCLCCLLSVVSLPSGADILNPYSTVNDQGTDARLLCNSFGQGKTDLIKQLLDKAGDTLVNGTGLPLSSMPPKGTLPKLLVTLAKNATYEEWQMVIKYLKSDEVYAGRDYSFGGTLLHCAAQNKVAGLEIVKFLVEEKKLDVNAKDKGGCSPIFWATAKVIEYLVSQGAEVDAKSSSGDTPLIHCCAWPSRKPTEEIGMLLKLGADPDFVSPFYKVGPLYLAAENRQAEAIPIILNALKSHKVKQPDGSEELYADWVNRRSEAMVHSAWTPLAYAVENSPVYYDCNTNGCIVDVKSQVDTVKALIACGADVNIDLYGYFAPLFLCNRAEVAEVLLAAGASMWSPNFGMYALHHFVGRPDDNPAIVELLLKRGADPYMPDNMGFTPYQTALRKNACSQTLAVFRKYRADVFPR